MRRILLGLIAALGLAGLVRAAEVLPPEPGIEGTISSQVEAFQDDDFGAAFGFASDAIRQYFGTPERFGAMVRQGYPMVWRPEELRFLELRDIDGRLWQKIMVRDRAGVLHVLDYQMIETPEGWRINGVQILCAPDVGA
jgi:predicted hydrolase (HD superfamily)